MKLRVNVFLKSGSKISADVDTDDSPAAWLDQTMHRKFLTFDGGHKATTMRVSEIESIEAAAPGPDFRTDRPQEKG